LSEDYTEEEKERHAKVMEDFKNRYVSSGSTKRRQEEDHYEKREGPSHSKRTKVEEVGSMPAPPDPYTAMCMYYSKLSAFRPWSPKAGFPPFQGYPLQPPYNRATPTEQSQDVRRPEAASPASVDRYQNESPHVNSLKRKVPAEKEEGQRFPTLAEEISTVAEALTGAPVHAKETVLKILERLTQRLDRAERDRDLAIGRYRELQSRYEQLEEELSKKRGELRELLRQDNHRLSTTSQDGAEENMTGDQKGEQNGTIDGIKEESDVNKVSLENLSEKMQGSLSVIVERAEDDQLSERSTGSSASRLDNFSSSGLPKIELKSPARVMEESVSPPRSQSLSSRNEDRMSEDDILQDNLKKIEAQLNHKTKVIFCAGLGESSRADD
jgi:exonuclease VII small subunit